MPKPRDELSALFRSLGPGDSSTQVPMPSQEHGAEQRWPLLKAMAPTRPATVPSLTDDEKMRWTQQEAPSLAEKKRSLTVPGLSDKLAKSLGKMSGRSMDARSSAPEKTGAGGVGASPVFLRESVQAYAVAPELEHSKPEAKPAIQAGDAHGNASRRSLFKKATPEPLSGRPSAEECISTDDDSLVALFERLAKENAPAIPAPAKKSSFFRRLGRK